MANKMPFKGKSSKGLKPTFGKKHAEEKTGKTGKMEKSTSLKTPSVTEADLENAMKGLRKR